MDVEHALKLGLVDMTVPANRLFEVAYQLLLENQVTKADYKKPKNFLHKWRKNWKACHRYAINCLTVWKIASGNERSVTILLWLN